MQRTARPTLKRPRHPLQTVAPAADPHAGHATSASGSTAAPAMDHGNMQMQGGSAPPDARDPHGYSNGLTLGSGDYAVPGVPRLMLADEHRFFSLRGETLERRFTRKGDDSTAYDLQAWYGTIYNKAVVKAEGDIAKGKLEESRTELLWGTPSHRTGTPSSAFGWITGRPEPSMVGFRHQGLAPTGSSWRRRATWEVVDVRRCVSKAATSCC